MSVVAIQGVRGSYSEEAAWNLLGQDAEIVECQDFAATFAAVATSQAEFAVVPVENKIVGEIADSVNLLRQGDFRVHDRFPLRVKHVLAGTADASVEGIETVRSHVEALKQCRRFLGRYPEWGQIVGADTASSIRRVVEGGLAENAAIGSRRAAELYGAKILAEGIADDIDNWTTFFLIGRNAE